MAAYTIQFDETFDIASPWRQRSREQLKTLLRPIGSSSLAYGLRAFDGDRSRQGDVNRCFVGEISGHCARDEYYDDVASAAHGISTNAAAALAAAFDYNNPELQPAIIEVLQERV